MFIHINKLLLSDLGKKYKWIKPACCPSCSVGRLYGHGYVSRIFDGFETPLFLKRYRCTKCHSVITMRPIDHPPRYQTSLASIYKALAFRFQNLRWPFTKLRQRAGHWLRRFLKFIRMEYGDDDPLVINARIAVLEKSSIDFLSF
jgi:hypothetical protein